MWSSSWRGRTKSTAGIPWVDRPSAGEVPCAPGAAETFEAVVDRQAAPLVRSLTAMFLDRELAADAAQDAFVQLYLHWDRVTAVGSPDAWLYRVAVNRCRDYRRALYRASQLLERLVSGPREDAEWQEWEPRADFIAVVSRLPRGQRVAAALYYDADLSVSDIARVMGVSEGTVNSHLHRARTALRKIVEAE